jgi:signal transduction histidine kinase
VKSFLDLARKERPVRERVNVHELIEKTLALLEAKPTLKIVREFRSEDPIAELDPSAFQGALYNLFLNAVQAMEGKGTLRVGTDMKDGALVITVSDTGPGIPEDLLPHVFEPFRSGRPGGTGLGLAIVKSVVEGHGGKIKITSTDEGSSFLIVLNRDEIKDKRTDTIT